MSWKRIAKLDSAVAFDISSAIKLEDEWDGFFDTRQTIAAGALSFVKKAGD